MDIYVVNIIRQVLLIYAGNFFCDDFIIKLVRTQKTQYIQSDMNM